jgi:hypothetical protein
MVVTSASSMQTTQEPKEDRTLAELDKAGTDSAEKTGRGAHLPKYAKKGGEAVVEKYGVDHMRKIGGRGASKVAEKYGLRFYSEIAARNKGVKKRKAAAG